jgi:GH25 family lysozyme M1 (1,4-beta-N-acetylmuramidase)
MLKHSIAAGLMIAASALLTPFTANSQPADDDINPALLRRSWLFGKELEEITPKGRARASPFVLTAAQRETFRGTFGINFSHYDFDIDPNNSRCKTQEGYLLPQCSCTIDYQRLIDNGLVYTYSKATDGESHDLAFSRYWSDLLTRHQSKQLFRGAYHFLRPGISAEKQAAAFLRAVGGVDGNKPPQLPPIVDIEWTNRPVAEGSPEFNSCPTDRRTKNNGKYYCDMWYTMSPAEIARLATKWIEIVEKETGRPVAIYTNVGAWWNPIMGSAGLALARKQAFWLSRYTLDGPKYRSSWSADGGSAKWKMPPLPTGVSFPANTYGVAHFWQFTEDGRLPLNVYTCQGQLVPKSMELNWVPAAGQEFRVLFGVDR